MWVKNCHFRHDVIIQRPLTAKTAFHHCAFTFITAHFVQYCTLKHDLNWAHSFYVGPKHCEVCAMGPCLSPVAERWRATEADLRGTLVLVTGGFTIYHHATVNVFLRGLLVLRLPNRLASSSTTRDRLLVDIFQCLRSLSPAVALPYRCNIVRRL